MAKVIYTKINKVIVDILKEHPDGLTLAEISEIAGFEIKPGHATGTAKKGLIEVIGVRDVIKPSVRKVAVYEIINANPIDGAKYTENETGVLAALAKFENPKFTLRDLAAALGKERLTSGHTNGLVKKGNIKVVEGEAALVPATIEVSRNVYGFVADLPADAEVRDK